MNLLAIDPGSEQTGWVLFNRSTARLDAFGISPNEDMRSVIANPYHANPDDNPDIFSDVGAPTDYRVLIEDMTAHPQQIKGSGHSYVPQHVIATQRFIGRLHEIALQHTSEEPHFLKRATVRKHLDANKRKNAGSADSQVRTKLIDLYGGKEMAIGKKAKPGPLYGVTSHVWQALGLAITFTQTRTEEGLEF